MSVFLVTTYLSISYVTVLGVEGGLGRAELATSPVNSRIVLETGSDFAVRKLNLKGSQGSLSTSPGKKAGKAPAAKTDWYTSYEKASKAAIRTRRPMLLHFEAPWCGACRQMESTVLSNPKVKAKLGKDVIGVRLNADVNQNLIAKFGIATLPTEVVVLADGTEGEKFVGATSLNSYLSRLDRVSGRNREAFQQDATIADATTTNSNLRSCLIVTRNGEMVGLGGFSPVSLRNQKAWEKGNQMYVATHAGVLYYLTSPEELAEFQSNPELFVPKFHGCDLVTLRHDNEARTGAIEYGTFYDGHMYFFASVSNRDRFQKNPAWYLQGLAVADLVTPAMLTQQDESLQN